MKPKISLVLPCQNEEASLDKVLIQAKRVLTNYNAEIIVSDSSTDTSPSIAKKHHVVLVKHDKDGYGNALTEGFKKAKGTYIIFADADGTYDMRDIPAFIEKLDSGYDIVLGNRFGKQLARNSMPPLHRHLGNPTLSLLLKLAHQSPFTDAQCGMRGITNSAWKKLKLNATGMEFASEMVIKATRAKLRSAEIPIHYHPRKGTSKLRPWSDGMRHLKLILQSMP